jgi:hypothetical protein
MIRLFILFIKQQLYCHLSKIYLNIYTLNHSLSVSNFIYSILIHYSYFLSHLNIQIYQKCVYKSQLLSILKIVIYKKNLNIYIQLLD